MFRIAFSFHRLAAALTVSAAVLVPAGHSLAEPITPAQVTIIELSAEASRDAPNDLARASAYYEAQDASPRGLADRVNRTLAAGLELAKAYPAVKAKSGGTSTWPVYGKNGRTIEGWRMHSEILLETRETAALTELLGKLQNTMLIGQLTLLPSPETRKKAEDQATLDAIAAFQARASLIAKAMNKSHRLRQISINTGAVRPIPPMARGIAMAEAAPPPVEAGDTAIAISVTGQIEVPVE